MTIYATKTNIRIQGVDIVERATLPPNLRCVFGSLKHHKGISFTYQIILGTSGLINGVGKNKPREETTMMQICFEKIKHAYGVNSPIL